MTQDKYIVPLEWAVPGLLISVPELQDPNFFHSVILMIEHTEEGAMGLILNRESEATVRELCADQGIEANNDRPVRVGGPVGQERVWVLHNSSAKLEEQASVAEGIWLSYTLPTLEHLAQSQSNYILVAGHAGWGPGQLEREMEEGAWLPYPVQGNMVFEGSPDSLWDKLIVRFGNMGAGGAAGFRTRNDLN